jgi:hypothetical protein
MKNGFFGDSQRADHDAGELGSEKFSAGLDFKRVKNNLQYFEGNIYSLRFKEGI